MKISDFLSENIHWVIIVVLLVIVTIIGFLADKKKTAEKKVEKPASEPTNNENTLVGATNNDIPAQPLNANEAFNKPINTEINNIESSTEEQPTNTENVSATETNNIEPTINQTQTYNSIGYQNQQTPNNLNPQNSGMVMPNMMNNMTNATSPMSNQQVPQQPQYHQNNMVYQAPNMQNQPQMATPNYHQQPMNQPLYNNQMNMNQTRTQSNTTIPTAIPTPRPIAPQPIMTSQPMQNKYQNLNMMGQMSQPQPVQTNLNQEEVTNPQPSAVGPTLNFVFGPQDNNNQ